MRLVLRDYGVERLFHAAIQSDIRDFMQISPREHTACIPPMRLASDIFVPATAMEEL